MRRYLLFQVSNRRLLFLFQRGILVPGLNSTLILDLAPQAEGREFRGVRVSNGVSHHPPCALLRRHSLSTMKPRFVSPPPRRDDTEPHRLILCLQRVKVAAITRNRLSVTLGKWYTQMMYHPYYINPAMFGESVSH